jgi:hypothetical protein
VIDYYNFSLKDGKAAIEKGASEFQLEDGICSAKT